MEEQKIYIVGGVAFTDLGQAKLARIEQKRIKILDEKLDYRDLDAVANVYKKARDNRTFTTPIGITYMLRLYDWLYKRNYAGVEKMYVVLEQEPAKVQVEQLEEDLVSEREALWKSRMDSQKKKTYSIYSKLRLSVGLNLLLVLLVVVMFVISQTGKNPTVLNYKTKIINQYASWEQELSEREQAIKEKEAQLGITQDF